MASLVKGKPKRMLVLPFSALERLAEADLRLRHADAPQRVLSLGGIYRLGWVRDATTFIDYSDGQRRHQATLGHSCEVSVADSADIGATIQVRENRCKVRYIQMAKYMVYFVRLFSMYFVRSRSIILVI